MTPCMVVCCIVVPGVEDGEECGNNNSGWTVSCCKHFCWVPQILNIGGECLTIIGNTIVAFV